MTNQFLLIFQKKIVFVWKGTFRTLKKNIKVTVLRKTIFIGSRYENEFCLITELSLLVTVTISFKHLFLSSNPKLRFRVFHLIFN